MAGLTDTEIKGPRRRKKPTARAMEADFTSG
jgi:hypothetical protein